MSSFFTIPQKLKKRKRSGALELSKHKSTANKINKNPKLKSRKTIRDESISGSEDDSVVGTAKRLEKGSPDSLVSDSSDAEGETAAEQRLKLAERYLENIQTEVDEVGFDAEQIDRDLIAERLVEDNAESKGILYRRLAVNLNFEEASHSWFRWNSGTVTSVATCAPWVYTVSCDIGLAKWKIQELPENQWVSRRRGNKQKKPKPPPKRRPEQVAFVKGSKSKSNDSSYEGHVDKIISVAASQDGKYVVTGGKDRKIIVWDAITLKCLRVFTQHRDTVTGLAFRRGTNQLYSSSKDRTIKIWSLDELAYVETLFGHQDEVLDISTLAQERCVSVGARDRTARLWKVVEETQLVFRGGGEGKSNSDKPKSPEGSIDRVAMIDEEMFVTGSDNGSISLWAVHKKKPIFTLPFCHGFETPIPPNDVASETDLDLKKNLESQPRWITALATVPYSDVVLSGSWDGFLRAWRVSDDKKKLVAVGTVGAVGGRASDAETRSNNDFEVLNSSATKGIIKGIINDISVIERGDRGKDGICIIAAVGRENRMGRWQKVKGKNGAVVFEVSYR